MSPCSHWIECYNLGGGGSHSVKKEQEWKFLSQILKINFISLFNKSNMFERKIYQVSNSIIHFVKLQSIE